MAADGDCPSAGSVFHDAGDWSPLAPHPGALHILAIGSSSTAGIGASETAMTYPAQLAAMLARDGTTVDIENAGVSGETADATIGRLEQAVAGGGYDLVIWQVGTNDAVRGGDIGAFQAQVSRGIAAVRQAGSRLVLLNQQFYPGVKDVAAYERFVHVVDALGAANKVAVFSRYAMMKAWSNTDGLLLAMLSPDRFHMNDSGYRCVAEGLARRIAEIVPAGPEKAPAAGTVTAVRVSAPQD